MAELLVKMSGLPYRTQKSGLRNAPKGKLPYLDDDGTRIADSTFIRWHLEKKYNLDFDRGLDAQARAVAWTVEKTLEEHLYWSLIDARWMDDENFRRGPANFFRIIPAPLRPMIKAMVRSKVRKNMWAHGMGRHTRQEIVALASKDIESVAVILGDKAYLMGNEPCGTDATVFAFVAGTLCPHFDTPLRTIAESHPNLVAYSERMMQRYFPKTLTEHGALPVGAAYP